jgi:hypothetical protein
LHLRNPLAGAAFPTVIDQGVETADAARALSTL